MKEFIKRENLQIIRDPYYCAASYIVVNGVKGEVSDFGHWSESTCGCGCRNQRFWQDDYARPEILTKYSISEEQFLGIGSLLERKLHYGCCGLCS